MACSNKAFCGIQTRQSWSQARLNRWALPPGRGKLPILGDTLELLNPKKMVSYQVESRQKWGARWTTSVLFKPAVVITSAQDLALARRQESRPGSFEAFFPPHHQRLFGKNSLLVQSGAPHARLRRLIQSAMTPKQVAGYQAFINVAIRDFLESCKQEPGYFAMSSKLQQTMVRIIVQVLFGQDLGENQLDVLIKDLRTWSLGLLSPPLNFIPWSAAAKAMRARGRVEEVLRSWISGKDLVEGTLLFELLNAKDEDGNALSFDEIIDNVFTLVFAGIDTTASSLSSAFLKLSEDQELQGQVREKVAGPDGERVLDLFLSEVLRTNPPAPFAMRLLREPLKLNDQVTVPNGYLLVYGIGASLSEEQLFPKPSEFQLDRGASSAVESGAFGGGPRLCPGRFLATTAAKQLLSAVLGKSGFTWELKEGQNLQQRYIPGFFPVDGLLLKLQ